MDEEPYSYQNQDHHTEATAMPTETEPHGVELEHTDIGSLDQSMGLEPKTVDAAVTVIRDYQAQQLAQQVVVEDVQTNQETESNELNPPIQPVPLKDTAVVIPQPIEVEVEILKQSSYFWDLYDVLWGEMSYLVTKRIQLLEAFQDGRLLIAKYKGTSYNDMPSELKPFVTRPGAVYLKAFLVKLRNDPKGLEFMFVMNGLRHRTIGSQLIRAAGVTHTLIAPTDTKEFLSRNNITTKDMFVINEDRLFKDLLRMAIGFNSKTVRLLETKLNAAPTIEELVAADDAKKKKRNASQAFDTPKKDDDTDLPPAKKMKLDGDTSIPSASTSPKGKGRAKGKAKGKAKANGGSPKSRSPVEEDDADSIDDTDY